MKPFTLILQDYSKIMIKLSFNSRQRIQNHTLTYVFAIFTLMIILYLPMVKPVTGNEEQYVGYAWRSLNPSNFSALIDPANHRFLFKSMTSFWIDQFGFRNAVIIGRFLVTLLYSISLGLFFKKLGLSIISSCIIILSFIYLGQDILGGEWLFLGYEPKTLAYPFVFLGFSALLSYRFLLSYLCLVVATYFHFLVGGFWFLAILLGHFYYSRRVREVLLYSSSFVILCLPLVVMIGIDQFQNNASLTNSDISPNLIYAIRAPHHIAPFFNLNALYGWSNGIVLLLGITFASAIIYYFSNSDKKEEKSLYLLVLLLNLYLLLSLVLSYFDQTVTSFALGKLYLFRPSSLTLLLFLSALWIFIKKSITSNSLKIDLIILALLVSLTLPMAKGNWARLISPFLEKNNQEAQKPIEEVVAKSNINDIFLIDPDISWSSFGLSFERTYNRPTLATWKFVPTTKQSLVRWYELIQQKRELFKQGCPAEITNRFPIKYLIAKPNNTAVDSCGKIILGTSEIKVIKTSENKV